MMNHETVDQYKVDETSHIILVIENFHIAVPRCLEY